MITELGARQDYGDIEKTKQIVEEAVSGVMDVSS